MLGLGLRGVDGRVSCLTRSPLERVQRPLVSTGTIAPLIPAGRILGAFLQLLDLWILNDGPRKLLLWLAVVPEGEEKGDRHVNVY